MPWKKLFPHGGVDTLMDALAHDFDAFFFEQPKVSFDSCELGYIKEMEGPQHANIFGVAKSSEWSKHELRKQPSFEYQGHWSIWT
jgi:N-acetylglucosamine-6-sulfatase